MKKLVLVAVLLFGTFVNSASATKFPEWYIKLKKIELLKSTESDVVRLYGEPKAPKGKILRTFETKDGDLSITLSTGKCGTEYKKGYDVNAGVVERVEFSVNKKGRVKPEKLGIDLSQFEKFEVDDVPGVFFYQNLDYGIHFYVERGVVSSLDFQPSSEYDELYCP